MANIAVRPFFPNEHFYNQKTKLSTQGLNPDYLENKVNETYNTHSFTESTTAKNSLIYPEILWTVRSAHKHLTLQVPNPWHIS